mmetsp:Transcript_8931/g.25937  ORF Transcript_8931/g.25937 Transcript_8931/m.25937 type:complete len:272 (-) Transcript_8931:595-1410(-)
MRSPESSLCSLASSRKRASLRRRRCISSFADLLFGPTATTAQRWSMLASRRRFTRLSMASAPSLERWRCSSNCSAISFHSAKTRCTSTTFCVVFMRDMTCAIFRCRLSSLSMAALMSPKRYDVQTSLLTLNLRYLDMAMDRRPHACMRIAAFSRFSWRFPSSSKMKLRSTSFSLTDFIACSTSMIFSLFSLAKSSMFSLATSCACVGSTLSSTPSSAKLTSRRRFRKGVDGVDGVNCPLARAMKRPCGAVCWRRSCNRGSSRDVGRELPGE